jgi:hypothetical protein
MNLLTHLGLGDHLITYGLVRELEQRYGQINLFCKEVNFLSLQSMYQNTNVKLTVIKDEQQAFDIMACEPFNSLKLGYNSAQETELNFGDSFYKQANIDFECRNKYEIGKNDYCIVFGAATFGKTEGNPNSDYNFIHDTDEFKINVPGIRPDQSLTPDITSYCRFIENATEVHVIESSFKQLIEFLNPKGELFLHKFENKSFRVVPSRHNWEIIQH